LLDSAKKMTNLVLTDPLGYHQMMRLMQTSSFVMTDSGGIQKEAFMTHVPCITLRRSTEWEELVDLGSNFLVPRMKSNTILATMQRVLKNHDRIIKKIISS